MKETARRRENREKNPLFHVFRQLSDEVPTLLSPLREKHALNWELFARMFFGGASGIGGFWRTVPSAVIY